MIRRQPRCLVHAVGGRVVAARPGFLRGSHGYGARAPQEVRQRQLHHSDGALRPQDPPRHSWGVAAFCGRCRHVLGGLSRPRRGGQLVGQGDTGVLGQSPLGATPPRATCATSYRRTRSSRCRSSRSSASYRLRLRCSRSATRLPPPRFCLLRRMRSRRLRLVRRPLSGSLSPTTSSTPLQMSSPCSGGRMARSSSCERQGGQFDDLLRRATSLVPSIRDHPHAQAPLVR